MIVHLTVEGVPNFSTCSLWVRKGEVFFVIRLSTDTLLEQQGNHWTCGVAKWEKCIQVSNIQMPLQLKQRIMNVHTYVYAMHKASNQVAFLYPPQFEGVGSLVFAKNTFCRSTPPTHR